MYSVFSEKAPREMKVHYAFQIYGKFASQFSNDHSQTRGEIINGEK